MAICDATCKNGAPCKNKAKTGHAKCGKHGGVPPPVQEACGYLKTDGTLCAKQRGVGPLCPYHTYVERERLERLAMRLVWIDVLDLLWTHRNEEGARNRLTEAYNTHTISEQAFIFYAGVLEEEIAFMTETHAPLAVAKTELHALSLDKQNVHTGPVNKQTEEGLKLLLETAVPDGQDTLKEIADVWADKSTIKSVLRDVKKWFATSMCRTLGDFLYKRALDGLWARIKTSPAKEELIQRLWEECSESVGVCCDGHMSRLCNVMVGFDDSFKAPVSLGEVLQQRMAAIAAKEIHVHLKVGEAWLVFEELNIPSEQRLAWIEAF